MQALLRYPKHKRRAIAQEWARRSNAVPFSPMTYRTIVLVFLLALSDIQAGIKCGL